MDDLTQKLQNSGLFPKNIKNFLIEAVLNNSLDRIVLEELVQMLEEEKVAIQKIKRKLDS